MAKVRPWYGHHDHIHVRLEVDIGRHGLPDAVGSARDRGAAVNVIDLHDRSVWMVHCGGGLHVLRVEGAGEPEIAKFG